MSAPQAILNTRFGLRKFLRDEKYHLHDGSITKAAIPLTSETALATVIKALATAIVADTSLILKDVYTDQERKQDWLSLMKKQVLDENNAVVPLDARSRPGHKLLDHHMTHFWNVANHKGVSVRSLCTQADLEKAIFTNVCMHSTPYVSEIRRTLVMTGGLGNVTKYRAATSKAIVSRWGAKSVLDPCIGWGGRMVGALAADATYVGFEPDPNTANGLRAILADEAIPKEIRKKAHVIEQPAEIGLSALPVGQMFDLVLTSPPYYNLEIYTAGDQSTVRYPTWDSWVKQWYKPLVLACLARITPGGTSCWSVKNIKTTGSYPLADLTKGIHKDAGWTLVETVTMKGSGRPGSKRIQEGKETRGSEEETFCFQRAA